MKPKTFDALTKFLANHESRRQAFRKILEIVAGGSLATALPATALAHDNDHHNNHHKKRQQHTTTHPPTTTLAATTTTSTTTLAATTTAVATTTCAPWTIP